MAKSSVVQYRRLNRDNFPNPGSLKNLLVDSMRSQRGGRLVGEFVGNRRYDLDQDGRLTLLNKITERPHWDEPFFTGQLTYFEQGANVPALLGDPDADVNELDLGQFSLGRDASMIHGILYFVVIGDHLGLIESSGLRSGRLERFLTLLLTQCTILEPGETVTLNALFTSEGGRRVTEAREVEVKANPVRRNDVDVGEGPARFVEQDIERGRREGHSVIKVLEALDWTPEDIERLMTEVPPGGWLEGFFRFFIKSRTSRRQGIRRATLDEAFRNVDPADLTLLSKGKREKDGFVKLTANRTVETVGSLLNPTSAVAEIESALREWAASGQIDLALP
ncbi:MAG TPA: hypothetical protein VIT45_12425 [Allosphingosinicella sp.]